ncbi:MAG: ribbon-helix-helix domain-containing protein [Candidatus Solibacter sp.]
MRIIRFYQARWGTHSEDRRKQAGTVDGLLTSSVFGMVWGMATRKITITLDEAQLEEIRALVTAGSSANVSAFVKHAVRVALADAAGWREMLKDALNQTGGPLTRKEREWADSVLDGKAALVSV